MILVGIHVVTAVTAVHRLQLVHREALKLILCHKSVAAGAPIAVRINLPLCAGVVILALAHRFVRIRLRCVRRQLAKEQDVLRASNAHLRAVLALFRPSKSVRLVILAHNVGYDSNHPEILEPMLHAMFDYKRVERLHCRHARARRVPEKHSILHVTAVHATRLQHAQQIRRKEIHLFKELLRVRVVPEVIVAGRVFVVIAKRNAGNDLIHAVCVHLRKLVNTIIVDCSEMFSFNLHALHPYRALHIIEALLVVQPIVANDIDHLCDHLVVLLPLVQQHILDFSLGFGVYDIDYHGFRL